MNSEAVAVSSKAHCTDVSVVESFADMEQLVYFVESPATGHVKIGYTQCLASRLTALRSESGQHLLLLLAIPGTRKTEQAMHRRFYRQRDDHGEWFRRDGALAAFLVAWGTGYRCKDPTDGWLVERRARLAFGLTNRQEECLAFIIRFRKEHGFSPAYREIGDHFGFSSTNAVADLLKALQRKGRIRIARGLARAMTVIEPPLPIAAGGAQ